MRQICPNSGYKYVCLILDKYGYMWYGVWAAKKITNAPLENAPSPTFLHFPPPIGNNIINSNIFYPHIETTPMLYCIYV